MSTSRVAIFPAELYHEHPKTALLSWACSLSYPPTWAFSQRYCPTIVQKRQVCRFLRASTLQTAPIWSFAMWDHPTGRRKKAELPAIMAISPADLFDEVVPNCLSHYRKLVSQSQIQLIFGKWSSFLAVSDEPSPKRRPNPKRMAPKMEGSPVDQILTYMPRMIYAGAFLHATR